MSEQSIHLAFGPVQEFLMQARRTRDLWAGSYVLSYLAASALAGVSSPSLVMLPAIDGNPLVQAIREKRAPEEPDNRVGSVPHVAELAAPAEQAKQTVENAVTAWRQAWDRVGEAVRGKYARPYFPDWARETDEIWGRQVNNLWLHTWALSGAVSDPGVIACRKTLRAFTLPDEPGEKCTCCGAREALHAGDASRRGVRDFWKAIAESKNVGRLEVSPDGGECLCAVCTIKRFLPYVAKSALGWAVPFSFPSTTTMATLPWRLQVLQRGATHDGLRAAVDLYVEALAQVERPRAVLPGAFPGLHEAASNWPVTERGAAHSFLSYDGDWLYPDIARNLRAGVLDQQQHRNLLDALDLLRRTAGDAGVPAPGTFYALLAMDGDHMGPLLRDRAGQKGYVSQALGTFSARVQQIVEGPTANGILIYAGGDDVLAMLPMTTALSVAAHLRAAYREAFQQHIPDAFAAPPVPSISAGLVYAHMNTPLRQVVATVHRILDEDAKEKGDRDALAVAVWKRPGIVLNFADKWDSDTMDGGLVQDIERIRSALEMGTYSRGFLYHLRDLVETVTGATPGVEGLTQEQIKALLAAEYLRSRERTATREEAEQRVDVLARLAVGGQNWERLAPARLAAFLASEEL